MQTDLAHAIDFACAECASREVVLIGHCDGASNAFLVAAEDARVSALVCVDGFMAPSWRYRLQQLTRKALWSLSARAWAARWRKLRRGDAAAALSLRGMVGPEATLYTGRRLQERVLRGVAALRARDVPTLWAFSGDYLKYGSYAAFTRSLGLQAAGLDHLVLRDARHVYPEAYNRKQLIAELRAWLQHELSAPGSPPSPAPSETSADAPRGSTRAAPGR
jgi:hypothetical protein